LDNLGVIITKHPILSIIFLLSGIASICGVPIYATSEKEIFNYTTNSFGWVIYWYNFACLSWVVYVISGIIMILLFLKYRRE
jgi:hypothetical protein